MKQHLSSAVILTLLLAVALPAHARPERVSAVNEQSGRSLVIPAHAVRVSENVFSLGTAIDPESGRVVEGYAVVHPRRNAGKPDHAGGPKDKGGGSSSCYAFIAKDAKWKNVEDWMVNPTNLGGLSETFVFDNLGEDMNEWEDAAETEIFGTGYMILPNSTTTLSADTDAPDGDNEVYFADIDGSSTIAVTITWGIFGGPPSGRELVEWDMVFDDVTFDWDNDGVNQNAMDFENIAQHELGHALGLSHPDDSCTEETMYRFASKGEISKRDLAPGDIAGAAKLY